ncbi:MAG: DUF488 family protein [Candidatus Zixiibacteriota bacterium]
MKKQIFTIGHSNHSWEMFYQLLHDRHLEIVCDIRSAPYSKYVKWACYDNLRRYLASNDIRYEYLGKVLGGKRTKGMTYADIAEREDFQKGLKKLRKLAQNKRLALLCAEENPLRCHRDGLVAKNMLKNYEDIEIIHIRADGRLQKADLSEEKMFLNL